MPYLSGFCRLSKERGSNGFGVNPLKLSEILLEAEIAGLDRRLAALYLRDLDDVYLAHVASKMAESRKKTAKPTRQLHGRRNHSNQGR